MHVDKASLVSFESIQKVIKQIDNSIKSLETDLKNASQNNADPADKFEDAMGTFSTEARAEHSILVAMSGKMERLYSELSEYFIFDKQKYSLEEFFENIKQFKDQFKQVFEQELTKNIYIIINTIIIFTARLMKISYGRGKK